MVLWFNSKIDGPWLHGWHVGPIETGSGEEHVADECLDGRFADETDEEELLDDLGGDGPEGRES